MAVRGEHQAHSTPLREKREAEVFIYASLFFEFFILSLLPWHLPSIRVGFFNSNNKLKSVVLRWGSFRFQWVRMHWCGRPAMTTSTTNEAPASAAHAVTQLQMFHWQMGRDGRKWTQMKCCRTRFNSNLKCSLLLSILAYNITMMLIAFNRAQW